MASDIQSKTLASMAPARASAAANVAAPRSAPARELATPAAPKTSFADELAKAAPGAGETRQKPTSVPVDSNAAALRDASRDSAADRASDRAADRVADRAADAHEAAGTKPKDDSKDKDSDDSKATAAKNAAKPASKAAAPIKQAAVSHKHDVDDTPVVALLTGHLEKLDPASIPALVTGNGFLNQAMSQSDIKSFMDESHSVEDLVDELGLPQSLIADAKKLGLDTAEKISPNELFRALGVDPQRVFAEINSLKNNLLASGLTSYLARAQGVKAPDVTDAAKSALSDADPSGRIDSKGPIAKKPGLPNVGGAIGPAAGFIPGGTAAAPAMQANAQPGGIVPLPQPNLAPQAASPGPARQQGARDLKIGAAGEAGQSAFSLKDLAPKLAAMAESQGFDPSMLMSLTKVDPQSMPDLLQVVTPEELAAVLPDPLRDVNTAANAPKMAAATFDAFALMGDRMKGADVTKLDMSQLKVPVDGRLTDTSHTPDADAAAQIAPVLAQAKPVTDGPTLNRLMAELTRSVTANPASKPGSAEAFLKNLSQMPEMQAEANQGIHTDDSANLAVPSRQEANSNNLFAGLRAAAAVDASPATAMMPGKKISVDDLRLMAPADLRAAAEAKVGTADAQKFGSDGDSKQDQNGQDGGTMADKFAETLRNHGHLSAANAQKGIFKSDLAGASGAKETVLSPEARLEMMQKIVDRASFLSKSGGGTVRLDLGSPELGHIEMAVRMVDGDRVDLRIMTGSARTRDLMSGEMARLRDALGTQQIQLGKVEVGVGNRDQRSNPDQRSFGGNAFTGQNFSQGGQQSYRGEREALDYLSSRTARGRNVSAVPQVGALGRGLMPSAAASGASIQVRV